jgi:hypothetical protein
MKAFSKVVFPMLMFAALALSQESPQPTRVTAKGQNRFVGAWRLVSIEEPGANGQVHTLDSNGMFVFTPEGRASVQVMYPNASTGSAYAQNGYEASYGSYSIDDSSTFTFHIDGALVRTLIGKDLKRAYQISGNRLIVKSTDPNEHWKVVWEHY